MTHRFLPHHVCPHCCLLTTAIIIAHHSSVGSLLSRLECKGEIGVATMREKELLSDSRYSHRSHRRSTPLPSAVPTAPIVFPSASLDEIASKKREYGGCISSSRQVSPTASRSRSSSSLALPWGSLVRMSRKAKSLGTNPGSSSMLSQQR